MKKVRWIGAVLVPLAAAVLAYDQDTVPRPVRALAVGILGMAGVLGIPAIPPVGIAATKRDLPEARAAMEQAAGGPPTG